MSKEITHIKELVPLKANPRKHNPRNIGMIVDSLQQLGAARSIVIDENNVILAGNGTIEAAAEAGITKMQIVDADGETIIAVRRSGLTDAQKARLAVVDNRANETSDWDTDVLTQLAADGMDLSDLFTGDEFSALLNDDLELETENGASEEAARKTLAERFGVPPFSVLDARQGYWQTRKRAWLALGIQSELGRGGDLIPNGGGDEQQGTSRANATPGGSARPACDYSKRQRGDGRGRAING